MKSKPSDVLRGSVCYLSGAMDFVDDGGTGWRRVFIDKCRQENLGIIFFDPTNKPKGLTVEGTCQQLREEKRWDELQKAARLIRREDLRMVDLSDFMVIKIDKRIHICGSYDELFTIEDQKKPILAIVEGGLANLSVFLFAALNLKEVFINDDDCIEYLKNINNGNIELDKRWVFVRQYLTDEGKNVTRESIT